MLTRAFPLGPDFGFISDIHFETRDTGNVLDDLLVVPKRGDETTLFSISIKSNRQLTKTGLSRDLAQDAWDQWTGAAGAAFDTATGLIGLIVGAVDDVVLKEWRELQEQASATTPERLVSRLANDAQLSTTKHAMFESLRPTVDHTPGELETARLLARTRIMAFSDRSEGDFLNSCATIALEGTIEEGAKLWDRLLRLAADSRTQTTFCHQFLEVAIARRIPQVPSQAQNNDLAPEMSSSEQCLLAPAHLFHTTRPSPNRFATLPKYGIAVEGRLPSLERPPQGTGSAECSSPNVPHRWLPLNCSKNNNFRNLYEIGGRSYTVIELGDPN